ncbi:ISXO2-like transposase domain-containing protein [Chryseobacterium sp. RU37D]|uniref:IS1595 family transposase n=1 Tax=Chryseobacterium sp. RU37D TaxID=1907397 RepID=UPI000956CBBD|nr:IS1595 family transposase [Chryseobacterium sp. RU37D]SIQ57610.1 ISXO2-like transposase domain-containing protein [Chryseobacterium sp. RU37D]
MININFKSLLDLVKAFPDEQTCINHLEELRWDGDVISPFDPSSKVYKCKDNKYRCKNTGKYFNVKTNTIFDNTKLGLQKWFLAIYIVTSHKKGISSLQLSRDLDITQKSAWFMLQRIRKCFGIENNNELNNEVEADETYIGGKNKNRHANKKVEGSQGRSAKDKTPVVGMVERDGKLNAKAVDNVKHEALSREIISNVKESAKLYTDEWVGYKGLERIYDHSIVKHNQSEYVKGRVHTNTIEGFWSILKRGIVGIYHFTSKKHLQMYVDEFVFRYNTRKQTTENRFNILLLNLENKTTYKTLIYGR